MGKVDKNGYGKLGPNPFVDSDFKILVVVRDQGENEPLKLDKASVTKLYRTQKNMDKIGGLCASGKELFLWIALRLPYGEDVIKINRKAYMAAHDITSVTTYRNGVQDLIVAGIIQLTVKRDLFWINPKIFFAGSRIKKYPDKVVVYEAKNKRS